MLLQLQSLLYLRLRARMMHPLCGLELIEAAMASINWKHDAAAAFEEATRTSRMVLLDFSAAPM